MNDKIKNKRKKMIKDSTCFEDRKGVIEKVMTFLCAQDCSINELQFISETIMKYITDQMEIKSILDGKLKLLVDNDVMPKLTTNLIRLGVYDLSIKCTETDVEMRATLSPQKFISARLPLAKVKK